MTDFNNKLAEQFSTTTEELISLIQRFDDISFNRKPANGGWSAGEVAEHLFIFDERLNMVLEDATHITERDMTEQLALITPRVSNRQNKIDAPPFLIPSPGIKSQETLIEKIRTEREKILTTIAEMDLSLHSKKFPHRFFGEMTAYEWISLVDIHSKRHMEQLKELLEG